MQKTFFFGSGRVASYGMVNLDQVHAKEYCIYYESMQ